MSIEASCFYDQGQSCADRRSRKFSRPAVFFSALIFLTLTLSGACSRDSEGVALDLPVTPPLSRPVIGYGVINKSYTHLTEIPDHAGASRGYLRRGSVIRVIERRPVIAGEQVESWVLVEGDSPGWLPESEVDIYSNEGQARTAAGINTTGAPGQ
jgi:hypothetical protein